jgi:hypothetical protein
VAEIKHKVPANNGCCLKHFFLFKSDIFLPITNCFSPETSLTNNTTEMKGSNISQIDDERQKEKIY